MPASDPTGAKRTKENSPHEGRRRSRARRKRKRRPHPGDEARRDRPGRERDGVVGVRRPRGALEARREALRESERAARQEREDDPRRQYRRVDRSGPPLPPPAALPARVHPEERGRERLEDQHPGDLDPGGRIGDGRPRHGDPFRRPGRDLVPLADDHFSARDLRQHGLDGTRGLFAPARRLVPVEDQVRAHRAGEEARDLGHVPTRERTPREPRRQRALFLRPVFDDVGQLAAPRFQPRGRVAQLQAAAAVFQHQVAVVHDPAAVDVGGRRGHPVLDRAGRRPGQAPGAPRPGSAARRRRAPTAAAGCPGAGA